jgi:hypothetical protein
MASITVKKSDGTTDIVFDALSAAAGDQSPAIWRQDTGADTALPVGYRPILRMGGAWNGPKTARILSLKAEFPYAIEDPTDVFSSKDRVVFDMRIVLPQAIPSANLTEAAYQMMNLCASTLIKQAIAAAYPPT